MTPSSAATTHLFALALGVADDALIMSQRLTEWVASAPELEEDVALANIALDTLGRARSLLSYAGHLEGAGRDEDALAMLRDPDQFTNCLLVEQPIGNFATTITRLWIFSSWQLCWWNALTASTDSTLAAIAEKSIKELRYHVDHAELWVRRLGDGTQESRTYLQAGLEEVWPFTAELFSDWMAPELIMTGLTPAPSTFATGCRARWQQVITEATCSVPSAPIVWITGGRSGQHSPPLTALLAEMQELARAHPGATW